MITSAATPFPGILQTRTKPDILMLMFIAAIFTIDKKKKLIFIDRGMEKQNVVSHIKKYGSG